MNNDKVNWRAECKRGNNWEPTETIFLRRSESNHKSIGFPFGRSKTTSHQQTAVSFTFPISYENMEWKEQLESTCNKWCVYSTWKQENSFMYLFSKWQPNNWEGKKGITTWNHFSESTSTTITTLAMQQPLFEMRLPIELGYSSNRIRVQCDIDEIKLKIIRWLA